MNTAKCSAWLALLLFTAITTFAAPQKGQVIADPQNPSRLVYHDVYAGEGADKRLKPAFFCGPGDPEGFLYLSGQSSMIDKLIANGGNCIYMQTVRSHGGDGNSSENPFVDNDPSKGVDNAVLSKWVPWFDKMDAHGILIYFFFYDDGAKPFGNGSISANEKAYFETLVNKFEKYKHLIWIVAEEANEAFTKDRTQAMAKIIADADDYDHLVGSHYHSNTSYTFFGGDLKHYSMQYNKSSLADIHAGAIDAWTNAQGKYQCIYSENTAIAKNTDSWRKATWASAMGGLMPMLLGMMISDTDVNALKNCRALQQFIEKTDWDLMSPNDALKHSNTEWVMAREGISYIAYSASFGSGKSLGIKGMTAGDYSLTWLDIKARTEKTETKTVSAGDNTFTPPSTMGSEVALYITSGGTSAAPVVTSVAVSPDTATVIAGQKTTFTALVKDQYGATMSGEQVDWTVSDGGAISGGEFTSDGTVGEFTVTATSQSASSVSSTALAIVVAEYPAAVASDAEISASSDGTATISLPYTSVSPGPFEFTITKQPANGTVTNVGNDATYTATAGYSGIDTFTWTVTDKSTGKVSNEATVSVTVGSSTTRFYLSDNLAKTPKAFTVALHGNMAEIAVGSAGPHEIELLSIQGRRIALRAGTQPQTYQIALSAHAAYLLKVSTAEGIVTKRIFIAD